MFYGIIKDTSQNSEILWEVRSSCGKFQIQSNHHITHYNSEMSNEKIFTNFLICTDHRQLWIHPVAGLVWVQIKMSLEKVFFCYESHSNNQQSFLINMGPYGAHHVL